MTSQELYIGAKVMSKMAGALKEPGGLLRLYVAEGVFGWVTMPTRWGPEDIVVGVSSPITAAS